MKHSKAILNCAAVAAICLVLTGCSGLPQSATGGGGGTGKGTFTIGGSVTGLVGTGLVLQNGTESLPVAAASTKFTFTKTVASGASYAVTVATQPSNPAQNCVVTSGTGTASANVTTVSVTCTTNPVTATIGGTVTNLAANSSLVLQDNGGDSLTITANGPFTFKTPVTGPTDAYAVTVLTQPNSPNQICTVTGGSGIAGGNITSVAVNCVLSYTIGGTVTGLVGSGLVLQNSSNLEQLPISAATGNQAFTFKNFVPTGTAYIVTIATQPSNPVQTCIVVASTASGTATANVTNVAVTCPAVTYSVGGNVVGLAGIPPSNGPETDGQFKVAVNTGNTLTISENGPFIFPTPEALNDTYEVSIPHSASTQSQLCSLWNYKGVVTANVTGIIVDCGHDDWTWIDGTKIAGTITAPQYGSFPSSPGPTPNPYSNTPGARYGAAGWTDKNGNLWLFGGNGWELAGKPTPDTLDAPMNDLWVCQLNFGTYVLDYCQWQLVGGYAGAAGTALFANAQNEAQPGVYTNIGGALPTPVPGARVGAATWTDSSGNLWLFGGATPGAHFLNDLWMFNTSGFTPSNYLTATGQWTVAGGDGITDKSGVYTGAPGSLVPGARKYATYWTDASGNFWLFGGLGFDGSGNIGFLNDLWEYTGGNWVWVSGGNTNMVNQNGIYGTAPDMPGGRQQAVGWADSKGNLWLFGGEGEDSVGTANGILNDLWMYNIASKQWTFVAGSTMANQTGTYESQTVTGPVSTTGAAGTCGLAVGNTVLSCQPVSTTGAFPGSRWGASGWIDAGNNLWLFGGWGLNSTATNGNGALNDLWVYTPNATAGQPGTWVWVKGSNTGSQNGIYLNAAEPPRPYATYYIFTPGGRSNATSWVDGMGQFWLFGGEGYDSTNAQGNGYLSDLWRYLPYQDY